jgi:hypothetical protein
MNCCDENGRCRCPNGDRVLRFAPGVLEHTHRPTFGNRQQRRELVRWACYLVIAALLCLAAAGGGLIAAYFYARWVTGV